MAVPFCIPNIDTSEFLLLPTLVGTGCFLKHCMFEPFYRIVSNSFNFHFLNMYDVSCLFPCLVAISASSPLKYLHVLVLFYKWGVYFLIVELESSWILDDGLWLLQTVLAALKLNFSFSLHCFFFSSSQLFFFHGSCLLYCTFKVIAKSPKIPLLLTYRNFHFNFRVIIYFETIFMRICFQNLAPSLKGLFFARDKLTVFLSLLWVPFVFCWSIGLVFREFHCSDDCSLTDSHVTSSTLFFYFISSVLVIITLLPFYEHFRISPLTSVKRLAGTLNWMALSL